MHDNGNVISFERIPILAEHISIPAHDLVTSSNHKYSFSEAGSDVCFHSPKSLPEGSTSLALFLKETSRGFLRGEDQIKMDTASELLDSIKDVWDRTIDDSWDSEEERSDDPISQWLTWGETLRQEFGIEQFAFVQWKDEL